MHNHLKDDTNLRLMKGNFGMKELQTHRSNFGNRFTSLQHTKAASPKYGFDSALMKSPQSSQTPNLNKGDSMYRTSQSNIDENKISVRDQLGYLSALKIE